MPTTTNLQRLRRIPQRPRGRRWRYRWASPAPTVSDMLRLLAELSELCRKLEAIAPEEYPALRQRAHTLVEKGVKVFCDENRFTPLGAPE